MDGDDVAALRDPYVEASPDGSEHWPIVIAAFRDMVATEPTITVSELSRIVAPALILVGDDDRITLEHTASLFRAVPGAELGIVPGTSHLLLLEKPSIFNRIVLEFLVRDPIATLMPLRGAR